jgi:hypothetical protein
MAWLMDVLSSRHRPCVDVDGDTDIPPSMLRAKGDLYWVEDDSVTATPLAI